MPRKRRQLVPYGIYHIIVKGIGSQLLFEDEQDRIKFYKIIKKYKDEQGFLIYGYCFMDNHVHLLLKDVPNNLSTIMKKINVSYVSYFNKKYERTGSLFHGRFRSEIITDNDYLLSAFKYILMNPQKAGISDCSKYKWSSYKTYLYNYKNSITDTDFLKNLFKTNYGEASLKKILENLKDEKVMDIPDSHKLNDNSIIKMIKKQFSLDSPQKIRSFPKKERDFFLKELKKRKIPIRQIERLTGISRLIISRI